MSYVLDYLRVHGAGSVLRMVEHMTEKLRIIVTIIAVLELTKNHVLRLRPTDDGGDILVEHLSAIHVIQAGTA